MSASTDRAAALYAEINDRSGAIGATPVAYGYRAMPRGLEKGP